MKSSQMTGAASSTWVRSRSFCRAALSVAGVMRSTMPLGKATSRSIHAARSASLALAKATTARLGWEPLGGGVVGEVGGEGGGLEFERPVLVDEVAPLGDGQRDDADVRVAQLREHRLRAVRGVGVFHHALDDARDG